MGGDMSFSRQSRGPYICYAPTGDFNAAQIVQLKTALTEDLHTGLNHFALDLRKVENLDNTGFKFIKNMGLVLQKDQKQMVFFGANVELKSKLEAEIDLPVFGSLQDFEGSFHEMNPKVFQNYFELAYGNSALRTLNLKCPICGNEHIKGFFYEYDAYGQYWSDNYITPVWKDPRPGAEKVDLEMYKVAVCSECLFASTRMDWFGVNLPEGLVPSVLTQEEKDRIANKIANRKEVALNHPAVKSDIFFGFPRETKAAYLAWKLNEMTCRDIGKDKTNTDGFDIAFSNLMMCKYTEDNKLIHEQLDTALAWLHGVLTHPDHYSTHRIMQAYIYIASIYLTRDKLSEATKYQKELELRFSGEESFEFWNERIKELIAEERGA